MASASSTQGWNQNFAYDGFGNLTAKTGSGVVPVGSYPADPATNRLTGISYDANGNQTWANSNTLVYDVANRMISSTGQSLQGFYEYDASNKRVYQQKQSFNGSSWVTNATEFYFYGLSGKKIGTYYATVNGSSVSWSAVSTQVFFRGRLVQRLGQPAQGDIRASVGAFFPFGEDQGAVNNDVIRFATYTRDGVSGLDYAVNRYYSSAPGRYLSMDPLASSARLSKPQSFNRYSYVEGDPIAYADPEGLCDTYIAGITQNSVSGAAFASFGQKAITVYPYAGGGLAGGVLDVASQKFGSNSATYAAVAGLLLAATDGDPINVVTFSGGAGAFTAAVDFLNSHGRSDVVRQIGAITYVSPGNVGSLYNNGNVLILNGNDLYDDLATMLTSFGSVTPQTAPECGHDFGCIQRHFSKLVASRQGTACTAAAEINRRDTSFSDTFMNQPDYVYGEFGFIYGWFAQWGLSGGYFTISSPAGEVTTKITYAPIE